MKLNAETNSVKSSKAKLQWDKSNLQARIEFILGLLCLQPSTLHVEFLDVVEMGALNWQFRGKGQATDVLSFVPHAAAQKSESGLSERKGPVVNLGDLAVCVEVCATQAKRHRCSLADELERMIVHGLVHLKGLDHDRSPAAYAVMTALEKAIRTQLKLEFGAADFCRLSEATETPKKREVRR
ncbi:MAG: rRNA maturation RNase YbeY [Silvanigrellaceae bacterium]